jgi:putative adhesin
MRTSLWKLGLSTLILLLCVRLGQASSVQGSFERTYPVTGGADLEVLTHSGDVLVRGGPAGTVSVSGKIHIGDAWWNGGKKAEIEDLERNPPIRQSGTSIRIDYVNLRNVSIDYEITVPDDTRVRTRTDSGDQTIQDLRADLDLESGSGDMRLSRVTGPVHVHTGSGNIEALSISGPISAEAGSGDLRLQEKADDEVNVRTGSGNIEILGITSGLRADAGSGDVTVEGRRAGNWEIRTGSGNVRLRLPPEAQFNLEARTSSGTVVVDPSITMTVQGRVAESRRFITGTVRGGGPPISVHTGSGDIHVY